eukprot:363516-Chlamydomonas_euryale.AAC.25
MTHPWRPLAAAARLQPCAPTCGAHLWRRAAACCFQQTTARCGPAAGDGLLCSWCCGEGTKCGSFDARCGQAGRCMCWERPTTRGARHPMVLHHLTNLPHLPPSLHPSIVAGGARIVRGVRLIHPLSSHTHVRQHCRLSPCTSASPRPLPRTRGSSSRASRHALAYPRPSPAGTPASQHMHTHARAAD